MIRHTGANMETVRKRNRAAILKFINDHGPGIQKGFGRCAWADSSGSNADMYRSFCRRNSCGDRSQCEKQWGRT